MLALLGEAIIALFLRLGVYGQIIATSHDRWDPPKG